MGLHEHKRLKKKKIQVSKKSNERKKKQQQHTLPFFCNVAKPGVVPHTTHHFHHHPLCRFPYPSPTFAPYTMPTYSQTPEQTRVTFKNYMDTVKDTFLDPHMRSLVEHYGRGAEMAKLEKFGRTSAREIDTLARASNHPTMMPRLAAWDGFGNHTGDIHLPDETHEIGRLGYAAGGGLFKHYAEKGQEFTTLALYYLFAQNGEAGHACPMGGTAGMTKILRADKSGNPLFKEWLARLEDPCYDTHYHAAQFLTEVQGGSDVGANVLRAQPLAESDPLHATYPGWSRLYGEKWFCSVADGQLMLVVARPDGAEAGTRGLRAFIVPRNLPYGDKRCNDFRIRRLKDKLGTRSMPSGEIDFIGALCIPLQHKFAQVMDIVINTSRLYNSVASAAGLQRVYAEASAYARNRIAFDRPIIKFPMIQNTIAKLRGESYTGRVVCFFLANLNDTFHTLSLSEKLMWRIAINLNKFWTAEAAITMNHYAIDVLGGNGAIEEFSVLPRLLRDGIVAQQWEGAHNTLTSQVYRDCQKYKMHTHLFKFLRTLEAQFPCPRLQALEGEWAALLAAEDGLRYFKEAIMAVGPVMQYLLLMKQGNSVDPLVTTVAEHILKTSEHGYRPQDDKDFVKRVLILSEPDNIPPTPKL